MGGGGLRLDDGWRMADSGSCMDRRDRRDRLDVDAGCVPSIGRMEISKQPDSLVPPIVRYDMMMIRTGGAHRHQALSIRRPLAQEQEKHL